MHIQSDVKETHINRTISTFVRIVYVKSRPPQGWKSSTTNDLRCTKLPLTQVLFCIDQVRWHARGRWPELVNSSLYLLRHEGKCNRLANIDIYLHIYDNSKENLYRYNLVHILIDLTSYWPSLTNALQEKRLVYNPLPCSKQYFQWSMYPLTASWMDIDIKKMIYGRFFLHSYGVSKRYFSKDTSDTVNPRITRCRWFSHLCELRRWKRVTVMLRTLNASHEGGSYSGWRW
jgi:hypothetical protein